MIVDDESSPHRPLPRPYASRWSSAAEPSRSSSFSQETAGWCRPSRMGRGRQGRGLLVDPLARRGADAARDRVQIHRRRASYRRQLAAQERRRKRADARSRAILHGTGGNRRNGHGGGRKERRSGGSSSIVAHDIAVSDGGAEVGEESGPSGASSTGSDIYTADVVPMTGRLARAGIGISGQPTRSSVTHGVRQSLLTAGSFPKPVLKES